MSPEEKAEIYRDVEEFIKTAEGCAQKSCTLTLQARQSKYAGGEIKINKPGGKSLTFVQE